MNSKIAFVLSTSILSVNLFSAEPSAFGAGDLDNPNPYGLTAGEKAVYENKKQIREVIVNSKNQEYKLDSLRERLDGLQSIIESLTKSSHENKTDLKRLSEKTSKEIENSYQYEKRLSELMENNSLRINELNTTLETTKDLLNEIKNSYVSKDELNSLIKEFNKFKKLLSSELKPEATVKSDEKRSNWDVFQSAKESFEKKHYTKSIEDFEYLIEKNFKPAYSNYMIGEMNYRRKNYANAIAYFKKSASLYSKASYMPELMLHTAISMELTGDEANAQKFYNAVISKYPQSKEADIAAENLKTLQ